MAHWSAQQSAQICYSIQGFDKNGKPENLDTNPPEEDIRDKQLNPRLQGRTQEGADQR